LEGKIYINKQVKIRFFQYYDFCCLLGIFFLCNTVKLVLVGGDLPASFILEKSIGEIEKGREEANTNESKKCCDVGG